MTRGHPVDAEAVHDAFIRAYADSLETVFLVAAPVAAFAFLISWLLPQVPLRKTVAATDPGQTYGMPTERRDFGARARTWPRSPRPSAGPGGALSPHRRPAGLTGLRPAAACLLTRIAAQPAITPADLAEEIGTSTANLAPSLDQLVSHRLVATDPRGGAITLTVHGRSAIERLRAARDADLRELLDGWLPEQEPELDRRLRSLARDCMNADAARLRRDERLRSAA